MTVDTTKIPAVYFWLPWVFGPKQGGYFPSEFLPVQNEQAA
jgi:hypothetical protein